MRPRVPAPLALPLATAALSLLLLQGCAHQVAFERPAAAAYDQAIPIEVAFFMSQSLKEQVYSGRAWSTGIANKWVVPVGETVHQYALSYLPGAFQAFGEVAAPDRCPPGHFLLQVNDIDYRMEGQAAHSTITFSVLSPSRQVVMTRSYSEDGPSGYGRVMLGGAFAQKSAIRQSSHVVFENIFKRLVGDIRAQHGQWAAKTGGEPAAGPPWGA